jgi:DNA helicase-2/ATP-dependent DNA helicase PcrA
MMLHGHPNRFNGKSMAGKMRALEPTMFLIMVIFMLRQSKVFISITKKHVPTIVLVDFAELLLRAYELVKSNKTVKEFFHNRFKAVLVDEFQDTNTIQYNWLKEIASDAATITAVGDDDQSIYGWRGAKVENISSFESSFEGSKVIRLEQNYRSTSVILGAANALIDNNQTRLGKNLWTDSLEGERITLYQAYNEQDEARFIAGVLKSWMEGGELFSDAGIVYRSNAQSRALEEALLRVNIPYRIYGGLRFYERMEIKNAMSYLKVIFNPHDNPAFERSIANPTRGIGVKSQAKIRDTAKAYNLSYIKAAAKLHDEGKMGGKAGQGLNAYLALISECIGLLDTMPLSELMDMIIQKSGLYQYHKKEAGEKGQDPNRKFRRAGNLCNKL